MQKKLYKQKKSSLITHPSIIMRTPRSTSLAYAKFKKVLDAVRQTSKTKWTPTKAATSEMQRYIEHALMNILYVAIDNKKGRTLDEHELTRAQAFLKLFLNKHISIAELSAKAPREILNILPKKLCVKEIKSSRPGCRVTQKAVRSISGIYLDLTQYAFVLLRNAYEDSDKKRVGPDEITKCLNNHSLFDTLNTRVS